MRFGFPRRAYIISLILTLPSYSIFAVALGIWVNNGLILTVGLFTAFLAPLLMFMFHYALRGSAPPDRYFGLKRHLIWLSSHQTYAVLSSVDLLIVVVFFLFWIARDLNPTFQTTITLLGSFSFVYYLSFIYRHYVLNLLGMRYEGLGGYSMIGAASVAKLASVMVHARKKKGLGYLIDSLYMVTELLENRRLRLPQLARTIVVLEALGESGDNLPFDELETMSTVVSRLPKIDELGPALNKFLTSLRWPLDFDALLPLPSPIGYREKLGLGASLLAAAAAAVGVVFSDAAIRNGVISFITSNEFLGSVIVLLFGYMSFSTIRDLSRGVVAERDLGRFGKEVD